MGIFEFRLPQWTLPVVFEYYSNSGLVHDTDFEAIDDRIASTTPQNGSTIYKIFLFLALTASIWSRAQWLSMTLIFFTFFPTIVSYVMALYTIVIAKLFIRYGLQFDKLFHKAYATARSKEIASFGKDVGNSVSNKSIAYFLTPEIEDLIGGELKDLYLQLSSIKELWQINFLLRSNSIYFYLNGIYESSIWRIFTLNCQFLFNFPEILKLTQRLSLASYTALDESMKKLQRKDNAIKLLSHREMAAVLLEMACESLLDESSRDENVVRILHETINVLSIKPAARNDEIDLTKLVYSKVPVHRDLECVGEEEREIVDEIFEGYTGYDENISSANHQHSMEDTPPRDSFISNALLNELHEALVTKEIEWKKREMAAAIHREVDDVLPQGLDCKVSTTEALSDVENKTSLRSAGFNDDNVEKLSKYDQYMQSLHHFSSNSIDNSVKSELMNALANRHKLARLETFADSDSETELFE